jgi:hypothetical protein
MSHDGSARRRGQSNVLQGLVLDLVHKKLEVIVAVGPGTSALKEAPVRSGDEDGLQKACGAPALSPSSSLPNHRKQYAELMIRRAPDCRKLRAAAI